MPQGCCPFCSGDAFEDLSEHKKTCSEYQQLLALLPVGQATKQSASGEKKRVCPIQEIDGGSDEEDGDKENSGLAATSSDPPEKLTKRVSASVQNAKTPRPFGARELASTPPYLFVPGVGRHSPPATIFDGCFCCGNANCRYTNFTISDLRADCDDKLEEHDTRDPLNLHVNGLQSRYQCFTKDELTLEGTIVRQAVLALLASEDVFSHHKYVGSKGFDEKLRSYYMQRLPHQVPVINKYSVPLRLATKATLTFLRLECIECIREKFIGACLFLTVMRLFFFGASSTFLSRVFHPARH